MAPGFGDATGHGLGGFGDLSNCLVLLGLSEIQLQLVIDDVLPGAAIGEGVEEVFKAGLIRSQEDEGIGELAGAVASTLQAGGGPLAGRTELDAAAVGVLRRQEHQPGGCLIGHGAGVDRCGMEAGKVASLGGLLGQAGVEFGQEFIALAQVALAVLLGGAVEVGTGVNPVAVAVLLDEAASIA